MPSVSIWRMGWFMSRAAAGQLAAIDSLPLKSD
jgi:hypothetical protein